MRTHKHTNTHRPEKQSKQRQSSSPQRSSVSKGSFGDNEWKQRLLRLPAVHVWFLCTNECEARRRKAQPLTVSWRACVNCVSCEESCSTSGEMERLDARYQPEVHRISICADFKKNVTRKNDLETWLTPPMLHYFSPSNYSADTLSLNRVNRETHNTEQRETCSPDFDR